MPKLKLNPKALLGGDPRQLLLSHGEKIGLLGVGLLAVLFCWWGLSQPGLDEGHGPDDLESHAGNARQHFETVTWDSFPLQGEETIRRLADPETINPRSAAQLDATQYRPGSSYFDPLIFQTRTKRRDPELLTVLQPQVAAGFAAFAIRAPRGDFGPDPTGPQLLPGGPGAVNEGPPPEKPIPAQLSDLFGRGGIQTANRTVGVHWAVVTALVPRMLQQAKFDEVLADAVGYNPASDRPIFLGFQYQRRELPAGKTLQADEGWGEDPIDVNAGAIGEAIAEWEMSLEGRSRDAQREVLHKHLTWPLGPRIVGTWGAEMLHPEVPLDTSGEQGEEGLRRGGGFSDEEEAEPRRDMTRRNLDEEFAPGFGGGQGGGATLPPHYLLRLFDLDVQPGKRYQYRIRLKLHDVNFSYRSEDNLHQLARPGNRGGRLGGEEGFSDSIRQTGRVPPKDLSSETYKRIAEYAPDEQDPHRFGPWSEPTPAVAVPFGEQQWAGPAEPPLRGEPRAWLMQRQPDRVTGEPVVGSTDVYRGTLLNFKQTVYALDLSRRRMVYKPDHHFQGGTVVLDIRGGEKIAGGLPAPAEVLLMDPLGNFVVQQGVEDSAPYAAWEEAISIPKQERRSSERDEAEEGRFRDEEES